MRTLLRKPAVLAATGWSNSTLYDKMKAGVFPKPTRLDPNGRVVVWFEDEVAGVPKEGRRARQCRGNRITPSLRTTTGQSLAISLVSGLLRLISPYGRGIFLMIWSNTGPELQGQRILRDKPITAKIPMSSPKKFDAILRRRWIPTRSATPSTALVPQRKVGFPIPNARLLLGFQGTKTARREGISSPFSDAGGCTSPQNSGTSSSAIAHGLCSSCMSVSHGSLSPRGSQGKPPRKPSQRCLRCSAASILICEDRSLSTTTPPSPSTACSGPCAT